MPSRTYSAIEVTQRPGVDPFYLLSCQASDLLQWADAPRKRAEVRAGYQRDLDERRVRRIAKFLELDTKNILPSAVLVAVRSGSYSIAKDGGMCTITIELPDTNLAACREAMANELLGRLSEDERMLASSLAGAEAQADEEVEAQTSGSRSLILVKPGDRPRAGR